MANEGGPIGRANIELGADTSKLEAGLSAAKEKTVAAVVATEKAASAATETKKVDVNAEVRAEAEARYAASEKTTESVKRQDAALRSISDRIKDNTKQAREFLGAIRGAFGIVTGVLGVVGLIGGAIKGVTSLIEAANAKVANLANTIVSVAGAYDTLARSAFTERKYADEFAKRRALLFDFNAQQIKSIEEARDAEIAAAIDAGYALDSEEVRRAESRASEAKATAEKKYQEEYKLIQRAERAADESARIRSQEEENAFKATQQKIRDAELATEREMRMVRHSEMLDDIRKLMDDYDQIEREFANKQRDRLRAQAEQFTQLRNEINGLFNTSQLEVGINRVGSLIQTLIDKVGDNR